MNHCTECGQRLGDDVSVMWAFRREGTKKVVEAFDVACSGRCSGRIRVKYGLRNLTCREAGDLAFSAPARALQELSHILWDYDWTPRSRPLEILLQYAKTPIHRG